MEFLKKPVWLRIWRIVLGGPVVGWARCVRLVALSRSLATGPISVTGSKVVMGLALFVLLPFWGMGQSLLGNNPVLPQIHAKSLSWADFDGDVDVDLLMIGTDSAGAATVRLMRNDGVSFTAVAHPFNVWTMGMAAWGDYDGDGDPDLLQTGMAGGPPARGGGQGAVALWKNNGVGSFTQVSCGLPGVRGGSVGWADLDGDGDLDCVISGLNHDRGEITVVGRNDSTTGGRVIHPVPTSLPGFCCGDLAIGDVGGSALLDIVVTGQDGKGNPLTRMFLNTGSLQFVATSAVGGMADMFDGSVAIGDMEGDGDGDLLVMGMASPWTLGLWRNDGGAMIPAGPLGQTGVIRGMVRWSDFDGDGLQDFVYGGVQPNGIGVVKAMRQFPIGVFSDVQPGYALPSLHQPSLAMADWSGDGYGDMAISGYMSNGQLVAVLYKWNTTLNRFELGEIRIYGICRIHRIIGLNGFGVFFSQCLRLEHLR